MGLTQQELQAQLQRLRALLLEGPDRSDEGAVMLRSHKAVQFERGEAVMEQRSAAGGQAVHLVVGAKAAGPGLQGYMLGGCFAQVQEVQQLQGAGVVAQLVEGVENV
mmetsp:Transcript_19510/g.36062  ORF Transcript_19510/g.36062 Transcript_19510/m.36062 type:complete len:107 (+) Transcript_19510:1076-1396(+)